jgi:hypothetical protein
MMPATGDHFDIVSCSENPTLLSDTLLGLSRTLRLRKSTELTSRNLYYFVTYSSNGRCLLVPSWVVERWTAAS